MSRRVLALMCVAVLAATGAVADDGGNGDPGKPVLKAMTGSESGRIVPDVMIPSHEPEAEHAFTGMMPFYVPMQAASGETAFPTDNGIDSASYYNVDGVLVETRTVAKPLVNVFIYGPAIGVDGTAFAHSFMDTYGAVSLDDGMTWKPTNLSESAKLSSFNLDEDHTAAEPEPMPADHRILLGSQNNGAFHAPGYETPYTAHCMECHGANLTGTAQAPSCYSCHGSRWKEEPMASVGPIIYEAIYKNGKLQGSGENADPYPEVTVINGTTGDELFTENVTLTGTFSFLWRPNGLPPCTVAAIAGDQQGRSILVTDKDGVPLADDQCQGLDVDVTVYPGGVSNVFHAVAGNKVLVAWPSRFCEQGQPSYSLDNPDATPEQIARREAIATYLGIDLASASSDDLYLIDMFGVGGNQGSIDFGDEGYPQAGVVPFGCVWTARGVLVTGDDPRTEALEASYMRWFNAERLTSGRRDPNRIEVKGVAGAGFAITWQEDPEGLRPGQGLGPGEGWSGAVAHSQTDVWYSYIEWDNFDVVQDPADATGATSMAFLDYEAAATDTSITQKPKPFVPMAMPMRVTDNAKCNFDNPQPYCIGTANLNNAEEGDPIPADYGMRDLCADSVVVLTGNADSTQGEKDTTLCVTQDGLPLVGNIAATRPRLGLFGYDSDGDTLDDSAFVVFQAEESKGLGSFGYTDAGAPCNPELDEGCIPFDEGKDQWYYSFSMSLTDTLAAHPTDGLLVNLAGHGNQLNQPEVDWQTGEFYPVANTADFWKFGTYDYEIYNTEIARRASLLAQGIGKAQASTGKLLVIPSWKQGIMRQGGPADTMLRRILLPDGWTLADGNPYAFRNMDCDTWAYADGSNPHYPGGLCLDSAINLSGVVPDTCIDSTTGGDVACPTVDFEVGTYGATVTNPVLQGRDPVTDEQLTNTTKVLTWHQCPSDYSGAVGGFTPVACGENDTDADNLDDQSWYNPLDVSKGHRGFIDGDFVMFLYAWSPNWRLNAKGNDRYELYIRRSFDGGESWGTLPASFTASDGLAYTGDGTVTCETYRSPETQASGDLVEPKVCYTFPAGGAEHARNVTQHKAMRITTLDPRYAASTSSISDVLPDDLAALGFLGSPGFVAGDASLEDVRDPSRFFIAFETGDNTTVKVGEAEPLDLFYSRAVNFGDDYEVWAETEDGDVSLCYPNNPHDVELEEGDPRVASGFCNEFDQMEQGTPGLAASEASLTANPGGQFFYGVWSQISEETHESDAMARRIWWIDGYISETYGWDFGQGTGDGIPAN